MRQSAGQVPSSLKFGTSGLRGLVSDLEGLPAYAYTQAFAAMLREDGAGRDGVLFGRDLRASSPAIAQLCRAALRDAGFLPIDCGALPTPALASFGLASRRPAIMVTGSHIPEDRNGLKFYRADGEIDKRDEARILGHYEALTLREMPESAPGTPADAADMEPLETYKARYLAFFEPDILQGLTIGVYQHSSVARDLMVDILEALGARAVPLGRANRFIPVDTEALRKEDRILARRWASERALQAIVSTDGDADRPLIADESGAFLQGDIVGAMTARFLKADAIVTPITSNSALETTSGPGHVLRTRVGSPYVIEGIADAVRQGRQAVIGFEANGGVLLGSDIAREGRVLRALPTRDAMLPILCVLAEIATSNRPLSAIAAGFGFKAAASDRLKDIASDKSAQFLARLAEDRAFRDDVFTPLGGVKALDARDGLRMTTGSGETVHFRASGNAPELRVYVEAKTPERAEGLLAWGLGLAARHIS